MEHFQCSNLLNAALRREQQFSITTLEPLTREKRPCKPAIQAVNTLSRRAHSHIILTASFKHHVGIRIICVHTYLNKSQWEQTSSYFHMARACQAFNLTLRRLLLFRILGISLKQSLHSVCIYSKLQQHVLTVVQM